MTPFISENRPNKKPGRYPTGSFGVTDVGAQSQARCLAKMSWELWGQILANQAAGWSPQMMVKSKGLPPQGLEIYV